MSDSERKPSYEDYGEALEPPSKRARADNQPPEKLDDVPLPRASSVHPADEEASTSAALPSTRVEEPKPKPPQSQRAQKRRGNGKDKDKKRDFRRGTRTESSLVPEGEEKATRLPKAKCVLLMGFCGSGYQGMMIQYDRKVKTIEGTLFDALVKIGAVSNDNADDHAKVNLHRAARTDAGVHAAGNLISAKLITEIPGVPDFVARVNEELPPEIRVWSVQRVQRAFDARTNCDSRKYTYFFPSYLLLSPKPGSGLDRVLRDAGLADPLDPFWDAAVDANPHEDLTRKRAWRAPKERIEVLREIAHKYEGSHNFHNFTIRMEFADRSCHRFMKSIEVADPQVYGDTEWISVLFHGQSFMLHQRIMMSAMILAAHTGTSAQLIDELYGPRKVRIPKMPALGLLLEYPLFGTYNKKIVAVNGNMPPSDPAYRAPIEFDVHREAMEMFKEGHIYSRMRAIEGQEGTFDAWIRHIDAYAGPDLGYLNPKGIIPTTAVLRKGEQRTHPFKEKKRFDSTSFAGGKAGAPSEDEEDEDAEEKLGKKELADMEG